jgi:hypothetical protein
MLAVSNCLEILPVYLLYLRGGAEKSLARPTSRCRRTESWISAKSVAEQLGISRERVGSIIHEDLDMRKVTKGVLFLHDNAPAYRALATQKKLA